MISNVSARSWLPVVVVKRNQSLPTSGQLQMLGCSAEGVSGPPVQPFFFSSAMTFFWLNFHFAYGCLYWGSNGLKMLLCRTGSSFADGRGPVLT